MWQHDDQGEGEMELMEGRVEGSRKREEEGTVCLCRVGGGWGMRVQDSQQCNRMRMRLLGMEGIH